MKISAEELVNKKLIEMKKKANHNKSETLWCFRLVMISTLLSPLFIAFGSNIVCGKIIPAILSLIAASLTAWIQLRKPQSLWNTYRTAQRKIEIELELYQFNIDRYNSDQDTKDKILIKQVNEIYLETHSKWSDLVPSADAIALIQNRENDR